MEICKYCGEPFVNKGLRLSHYKTCPEKNKAELAEVVKENHEPWVAVPERQCKVLAQPPQTCEVAGEAFVLVKPEDYIPYECVHAELAEKDVVIRELEGELAKKKQTDAESDGEIYWPLSMLPDELRLLAEGQYVSLKCSGRIRGDKVIIQDVKLGR